jgi:plasmid stability protein
MIQLTLRVPDDLIGRVREAAKEHGRSVNAWATDVLRAAVDPELAGEEAARVRERLARAGLLATGKPRSGPRPDPKAVARARSAAGVGTPLSEIVAEDRR